MAFTAKDVQTLREMTGVGMMDCKKALAETDGDMDKAVEVLREKGMAAAAKKASRIAAEGVCYAAVCEECGAGAIVECNSETDFVAKNEQFAAFVRTVADTVLKKDPADLEALQNCDAGDGQTIGEALSGLVLKIGENMRVRRFARFAEPVNAAYVHMGGKIAVLVHMDVAESLRGNPAVTELGRDVAMQIAAMRPLWVDENDADADTVAKEREILTAQVKQDESNAKKPEAVVEKIVEGRVRKYLADVCLLMQSYVKGDKITVGQHVAQVAKELGGGIKVTRFERFEKGEGLEKRVDDLAAEVAKMVQ
ncbi:MAG: translation elongation factor Ts [Oscillospiraceae bacterium]|jgi:elongation factor Ts|nr:translation elongation factor Ts [Oscillospiraceae bacterium]